MNQIENEFLKVSIKKSGAEINSIINKNDGYEFIWNGEHEIWSRHAPVLFPFVGKLNNNQIKIKGKLYEMPQHGFARDFDFEVFEINKNEIFFQLSSSEKTLLRYPYNFTFQIKFQLEKQSLKVEYTVNNIEDEILYYSIGAHPGFMLPTENFEDYIIEFSNSKNIIERQLLENGLFNYQAEKINLENGVLNLDKSIFDKDAIVIFDDQNEWIKLSHKFSSYFIKMYYKDFSSLGIWSKMNCNKFICLEPWLGHADFIDFDNDISEKAGILNLKPFEKQTHSYTLTFNH